MKKISSMLLLAAFSAAVVGCVSDKVSPAPTPEEEEWNPFPFSTVSETTVSIDYNLPAEVYFEIYDKAPVRENAAGTAFERVEGLEPLYAGYTDAEGRFSAQMELPSYLEKAYVYTPYVFAQTLLTATCENGTLTASAYVPSDTQAETKAVTRAGYESAAVTKDGWKTWLGEYSAWSGRIDYEYKGEELSEKNWAALYKAASKVFDIDKPCPQEYRSSNDLYLKEPAEVAVTFLMSNTCWNCSMGYYYYDASKHPASLDEVQVIMLFPNTQDGLWSVKPWVASRYKGVDRGTAVQLKYFPNIASGSREGETTVFPQGYRIGFVLATNAWGNQLPDFKGAKQYRAATSSGLSVDDKGNHYSVPRTAVYRYVDTAAGLNSVICSFEDYTSDENFSDIVFTMKSNPIEAVEEIPSYEEKPGALKEVRLLKGVYAFEDLWPSEGDYDLNDVMTRLDYEKTFDAKGIYEESFLLKTYNNYAGLENGLAFTFTGVVTPSSLEFSILKPGAEEYEPYTPAGIDGDVVLLTSNVKKEGYMGSTYKVTARYEKGVAERYTAVIKPFVYRTYDDNLNKDITPGKRKEIHLPFEAPTDKVDEKFFGTSDDRSDPEKKRYYVRAKNYPFAIFLSGATEKDLAKMLDVKNEAKHIDELYPAYPGWVESNGASNADWYK